MCRQHRGIVGWRGTLTRRRAKASRSIELFGFCATSPIMHACTRFRLATTLSAGERRASKRGQCRLRGGSVRKARRASSRPVEWPRDTPAPDWRSLYQFSGRVAVLPTVRRSPPLASPRKNAGLDKRRSFAEVPGPYGGYCQSARSRLGEVAWRLVRPAQCNKAVSTPLFA